MRDYRVTVKVRNNRILTAIEAAGGSPGQKWCTANGLPYLQVNDLINLKLSPLKNNGELRDVAVNLCEVVGCLPEDLWSNDQLRPLERNFSELEMSHEGVLGLLSESRETSYLGDFESVEREQQTRALDGALASLATQQERVLRLRFHEEMTLEDVAGVLGVSRERIRQIEAKALRNLRSPKRTAALIPAVINEQIVPEHLRPVAITDKTGTSNAN